MVFVRRVFLTFKPHRFWASGLELEGKNAILISEPEPAVTVQSFRKRSNQRIRAFSHLMKSFVIYILETGKEVIALNNSTHPANLKLP